MLKSTTSASHITHHASRLLLVHGWATDSSVWKYQAEEFSNRHDVITLDLPGHGSNDKWSEPTLKPAIEKVLSTINPTSRTPSLSPPLTKGGLGGVGVGWSLGGQILLEITAKNPDLFKAIILVATSPCFVAKKNFPYGQPPGVAKRMLKDIKKDFFKTMKRFYPLNFTKEELASSDAAWFLEYYCEKRCVAFHRDSIAKSLEALLAYDIRKDLSGIKIPALVIQGNKDQVCPPAASAYLAENLPHAKVETFDDTGHAPFLTRPQEFNRVVKRFIEKL